MPSIDTKLTRHTVSGKMTDTHGKLSNMFLGTRSKIVCQNSDRISAINDWINFIIHFGVLLFGSTCI